jgi:hypothetical protein
MKPNKSTPYAQCTMALVIVALTVCAFLCGSYLLGSMGGITYTLVVGGLAFLFARSSRRSGKLARIQMVAVALLAAPIGYVLAFPASLNPDLQHFIDKQATDRSVRAELKSVLKSDPAFCELSISTAHAKIVNVTIHGALPTREDMQRLRKRIANECPTLKLCALHWNVRQRGTNEHIHGLDRDLFPLSDETG